MDTLQISLLIFIGLYFLLMVVASIRPGKVQSQENFSIANRQAGPVPIISSLAASFRDGSGIVIWIGFGLTIGYGAMGLIVGVFAAMLIYTWFGPRVRQLSIENDVITVGELIRVAVGPVTEKVSTLLVLAFSIVIVAIQLFVAGNLLAEIIDLSLWMGVVSVSGIVAVYLVFGGYGAVLKTDVIQFFLIISLIIVPFLAMTGDHPMTGDHQFLNLASLFTLPVPDQLALFLIGFLYMLSSADTWQKLFAARSDRVIRIGFPVSAFFLIIMSVSLIWLGMISKGLLPSGTEAGDVLFQLFQQRALPTVLLTFLVVVIMAITMSTLDTFCYLFSSSVSKNFLSPETTNSPEKYIRVSRFIMLGTLTVSSVFALTINNVIETVFSASSLLFILAPLYVAVGFGWLKKTARLDAMVSISMLVSACVYLVMFLRGDFADMMMLMVPVLVNSTMMLIAFWYEGTRKELAV
jgi:SSS family solute:Na+ symporter